MLASSLTFIAGIAFVFFIRATREPIKTFAQPSTERITIIVPHFGNIDSVAYCLQSLALCSPLHIANIIVILQGKSTQDQQILISQWESSISLLVLLMEGAPNKCNAIRYGLDHVSDTSLIMLVDSDVKLHSETPEKMMIAIYGADVAYGIIHSRSTGRRHLLNAVIFWDKAISHGVWRWGRWVFDLWPNIPGQCYLIRKDLLNMVYKDVAGYLDDLDLTLILVEQKCKIKFVATVVGEEGSRCNWAGLFLQRARWTAGIAQACSRVVKSQKRRPQVAACILLHSWLYHGWPVTVAVTCSILLLSNTNHSASLMALFIVSWSVLALYGKSNLRRCKRQEDTALLSYLLLPFAAICIVMAQTVGIVLMPVIYLAGRLNLHNIVHRR